MGELGYNYVMINKKFQWLLAFAGLVWVLAGNILYAQTKIDINQGVVEPIAIAVPNLGGASPEEKALGNDIAQVMATDLVSSGLFRLIDRAAYITEDGDIDTEPKYADWRLIKAQFLILGNASIKDNTLTIKIKLWDILGQKYVIAQQYNTIKPNWRRIAHKLADDIYERLTGEGKYFDSRIVYIAESGPKDKRTKRLAIMDQDGFNHNYLSDGSFLVLTPRFSPSLQQITYLSYIDGKPQIYLLDLQNGHNVRLGSFSGMSFAPRFSPDGKNLIFSYEENGNSDVFTLNIASRKVNRLTNEPAIDTSPSFSPDGSQIVFNSDRGGTPQLYVMNADGSNVKRISYGNGRYSAPVWSPRGDYIAFSKQQGNTFYIGVVKPDGSGERLLSQSYLDEGPSWSPNGRVIAFFRQAEKNKTDVYIYTIDITGNNLRRVITPRDGSDPAWSPLNPN